MPRIPEMALLLAKEQYARRYKCVNLWVVKTSDVRRTRLLKMKIYLKRTPDKDLP
jgi:1,2-phenylacetyl-CoA epoxidase PaaB subunit